MLALVAALVFAQSSATIQVGKERQDSIERARRDSVAIHREARRDSLHARAERRDSVQRLARIARQLPVTSAVLSSAFKDAPARELFLRARVARPAQGSSLTSHDAKGSGRISGGMGFKRSCRDRLPMRGGRASHV